MMLRALLLAVTLLFLSVESSKNDMLPEVIVTNKVTYEILPYDYKSLLPALYTLRKELAVLHALF